MNKTPSNNKYVKKINRMVVLNIVKEKEPASRQQLSEYNILAPPVITRILKRYTNASAQGEI